MKKILAVFLVAVITLSLAACGNGGNGEKFEWNDMELSSILPEPKSNVGEVLYDSEELLNIYIHKISKDEYKDYLDECQSIGFTVESDKSENDYTAYNEAGYKLILWYNDVDEELYIEVGAPMDMGTLQWPTSEIASLLPVPKSTVGSISRESSDGFYVYVGDTPKNDYNAYVDECSEKGFSVNYEKGDTYYRADNADGYHISLSYQGNNVMTVEIEKPEETAPDATPEVDATPEADSSLTSENEDTLSTSEPEPTPGETTESVDGIRPEFKAAMDSYEAFYDEYYDFMKKYTENPTDLKLLAEYTDMLEQLAEMDKNFEAWGEEDLSNEELKYYLDVTNRITQKMIDVM